MADSGRPSPAARTRARARPAASQRNPRLRLACLRCQRRKIKCGGELPSCRNCRQANADCVDGESARLRDLPTGYIGNLQNRVKWLEDIIRDRCPDVDLSQGPDTSDGGQALMDGDNSRLSSLGDTSIVSPVPSVPVEQPPSNQNGSATLPGTTNALSHEIGLISLGTNQDQRYIGPSSGYFLARVMLTKSGESREEFGRSDRDMPFPVELVEAVQGPLPLPSLEMAERLTCAYFDFIHPQYPLLHRPTFFKMLQDACDGIPSTPVVAFQVRMVLALGATVISGRNKVRIPGESYCLAAMQYFHKLNIENSLQGIQCLLLLFIFSIHNPYVRLNVWYLNYQCLAALLDIGLQRNITIQSGISLLEQEMRTRIFWVIYSLDRTIATMTGRPIGLRDEGCELRYPGAFSDDTLAGGGSTQIFAHDHGQNEMAYPIHLFRLARLNSEIKYVANSIIRGTPVYAYPPIVNIQEWQTNMLGQLDDWAKNIPLDQATIAKVHANFICQLRYHNLRMVLLRPSPAIPKPSPASLTECHRSAQESIRIMDQMYRKNILIHSWMSFYSIVMSAITMLYCIKVVPALARNTQLSTLMMDLGAALNILSAAGEHWSGAKRVRDILDDMGRQITDWLQRLPADAPQETENGASVEAEGVPMTQSSLPNFLEEPAMTFDPMNFMSQAADGDYTIDPSMDFFNPAETDNLDDVIRNLFQGFIPVQYPNAS